MNVIITGIAGFIGSNLLYFFFIYDPVSSVLGIDCLRYAGYIDNLLS